MVVLLETLDRISLEIVAQNSAGAGRQALGGVMSDTWQVIW
jgi:hypothetical protein